MRRTSLLIVVALAASLAGCKEKTELRELCALPKLGERTFETPVVAKAADALRKAEESESIATSLEKRRQAADTRRQSEMAANLDERKAAEALPLDDRDARRKAILEVTAKEQETQKLSDEIAKYFVDIERNQQNAATARKEAAQTLAPLQRQYGLAACPVLAAPAKAAAKP